MSLAISSAMNHSPKVLVLELDVNCSHSQFLHLARHEYGSVGGQKSPQPARTGRTVAWEARHSGRGEAVGGHMPATRGGGWKTGDESLGRSGP